MRPLRPGKLGHHLGPGSGAGNFKHNIGARAAGLLGNELHEIGCARIHGVQPQFLSQRQAEWVHLRKQDSCSLRTRHQRHQRANGPAALHDDVLSVAYFSHPHVMASHGERLDQCALCQRQIFRQPVQECEPAPSTNLATRRAHRSR